MSSPLVPGAEPPMIVPYCFQCDMPAERIQLDVVSSPYYIGVHASCCDRTQSSRVPIEDVYRIKRTNAKWYGIVRNGSIQGVREPQSRSLLKYVRPPAKKPPKK